jgi:hypothetical protein
VKNFPHLPIETVYSLAANALNLEPVRDRDLDKYQNDRRTNRFLSVRKRPQTAQKSTPQAGMFAHDVRLIVEQSPVTGLTGCSETFLELLARVFESGVIYTG